MSLLLILWCVIGAAFLFSFFFLVCVSAVFFVLIVGGGLPLCLLLI